MRESDVKRGEEEEEEQKRRETEIGGRGGERWYEDRKGYGNVRGGDVSSKG